MLLSPVINIFSTLVTPQRTQNNESFTCVLNKATTVTAINANSTGRVVIHDVYWKAKPARGLSGVTIPAGQPVTVVYREGLTLFVCPLLEKSPSEIGSSCS